MYDGGSSTSAIMGKYCGNSIPPSHVSSSNEIMINFQSDGSVRRPGFQIEYNPTGKHIEIAKIGDCHFIPWPLNAEITLSSLSSPVNKFGIKTHTFFTYWNQNVIIANMTKAALLLSRT